MSASERKAKEERLRLLEERERRLATTSLQAFLYRYLGSAFTHAPGEFHRGIYADLEGMVRRELTYEADGEEVPYDAAAYAYPRGHGKTTTVTFGFVLWVAYNWRTLPHFTEPPFIVIVSDTVTQARDRALDVRDEIEGNLKLLADHGNRVPSLSEQKGRGKRKKKWTETDFTLSDGTRIVAVGSRSKVRGLLRSGRRPTLIICDDLENDEAVRTVERRDALHRWVQKALIPTGVEGKVITIVVGTILHADSFLSRMLTPDGEADPEWGVSGWLKRRFAALYNDEGDPSIEGTHPLWPEFWTLAKLAARLRKVGSIAFTQEYLNRAVDDLSALFKLAVLRRAVARGKGTPFLYSPVPRIPFSLLTTTWDLSQAIERYPNAVQLTVTAWDIALIASEREAERKDSDFYVGTTVTLTLDDRIQVRRIYRKRGLSPVEFRQRVKAEQRIVQADAIVVENNAAQRFVELGLRDEGLPIKGHTTTTNKSDVYEGVPMLSMLLEVDRLDFCASSDLERQRVKQLVTELNGLGYEAHDDMPMSLWMALRFVRAWQRKRDKIRRKRVGKPPASYVPPYTEREPNKRVKRRS